MSDAGSQITELVESLMAHVLGLENLDPLREMIARSPQVHELTGTLHPHLPQIMDLAQNGRHVIQMPPHPVQPPITVKAPDVHVHPTVTAPAVHVAAQSAPPVHVHPPAVESRTGKTKRRIKGTWKGGPIDAEITDG